MNMDLHDDVIKWKHFPSYWPFVRGIYWSIVNSPHKGQWRRALMFSLICAWMNGWVNNREADDLRRHRAHYDVTVMASGVSLKDMDKISFIKQQQKTMKYYGCAKLLRRTIGQYPITVRTHDHYGRPSHWTLTVCSTVVEANNKGNVKGQHNNPFVTGYLQQLVDSSNKMTNIAERISMWWHHHVMF